MEPAEASFPAQLRRGVLEHCVLALVESRPMYGLDLARALHDHGVLDSEGTLYPLLSRLRRRGLVDSTWEESPSGPPRRYYRLTPDGATWARTELAALQAQLSRGLGGAAKPRPA